MFAFRVTRFSYPVNAVSTLTNKFTKKRRSRKKVSSSSNKNTKKNENYTKQTFKVFCGFYQYFDLMMEKKITKTLNWSIDRLIRNQSASKRKQCRFIYGQWCSLEKSWMQFKSHMNRHFERLECSRNKKMLDLIEKKTIFAFVNRAKKTPYSRSMDDK